jgi:hypothetical protein
MASTTEDVRPFTAEFDLLDEAPGRVRGLPPFRQEKGERMGTVISPARMSCRVIPRLKLMRDSPHQNGSGRVLRGPQRALFAMGEEAQYRSRDVFDRGMAGTPVRSGRLRQGPFADSAARTEPGPTQVRRGRRGLLSADGEIPILQSVSFREYNETRRCEIAPTWGDRMSTAEGLEEGTVLC